MTTALPVFAMAAMLTALLVAPFTDRWLRQSGRLRQRASRRRSRHLTADYVVVLDAVARGVRSGSSLTAALIDTVDATSPLGPVAHRLAAGGSLAEVLAESLPEVGPTGWDNDADRALVVHALSATAHLGGPIAATLDEAAAVLRERAAARAERRAHGSQARLSARVLTIVPLAFAAWSAVESQRTRDLYVSSVVAGLCALCGLALNLIGWRWMKRIIGPT